MLSFGKSKAPAQKIACVFSDNGYSLVGLADEKTVSFYESHDFPELSSELISKTLKQNIDTYNLYGYECQLILPPNSYELLLLDALNVPEAEMAKALRWQLKGLIKYPLKDISIDTFMIPPHGGGQKKKKIFAAVTPQSTLMNYVSMLEKSLLQVKSVSIAELAISHLLKHLPQTTSDPLLVVNYSEHFCELLFFYQGDLYFYRTIAMTQGVIEGDSSSNQSMSLEIQRSVNYCLRELKIPEPQGIFFTPNFYKAGNLVTFLKEEFDKDIRIMDINSCFNSAPIPNEIMAKVFYAIGGALMLLDGGDK